MLVNYNLDIVKGSSFSAVLTAKDETGTAINLAGYNLRGVIKYNYSDSTYLLSLGPQVATAASGIITISISAADTATLPVTVAVYDIEMYNDSGYVAKLLDGRVSIHPEVTDASSY